MRDKYLKLIYILQESTDYLKIDELAKMLDVSSRTIRNYINDLNINYLVGAEIINQRNKGYKLDGKISAIKETTNNNYVERIFFIVKQLMENDEWITYDEIGKKMFYSSQTIRNDVVDLQQTFQQSNLSVDIESVIFKGVTLVGDEIDKRLLLNSLINPVVIDKKNYEKNLLQYFDSWINDEQLVNLVALVDKELKNVQIITDADRLIPTISFFIISFYRIKNGKYIKLNMESKEIENLIDTREYKVAEKVLRFLGDFEQIDIPLVEYLGFALYLAGQHFTYNVRESGLSETVLSEEVQLGVVNSLSLVSKEFDMDFLADVQLVKGISMHLSRNIQLLKYNFEVENSFINNIKYEFIEAYYYAISFSKYLSKILEIVIPESEIGYYALYFASFIERRDTQQITAALVYGTNIPASQLLASKLEVEIEGLVIKEVVSFSEISTLEKKSDISLLISPIPLEPYSNYETYHISLFPNDRDLMKLQTYINKLLSNNLLKIDSFTRLDIDNKEEIIKQMVIELDLEYMYKDILKRESLSSTDIGTGVALPHTLGNSSEVRTYIGLAVLENKIVWGDELVDLVLLVIPGIDNQSETGMIMSEFYNIINDEYLLSNIKKCNTLSEVENIIES